ncbi:MAG: molybdopterin-binding protein, partial [Oscillospiraceae bacterium]
MNCEILNVGTELLLGDVLNTNAQFLSQELAQLGIGVQYISTVGDNEERLTHSLESAFKHSDIVITTGGLGPTADDLTKEVC